MQIYKLFSCSDREGFSREETMSRLQNFQRDHSRSGIHYTWKCLKVLKMEWDIVSIKRFLMRHLKSEWAIVSMSHSFPDTAVESLFLATMLRICLTMAAGSYNFLPNEMTLPLTTNNLLQMMSRCYWFKFSITLKQTWIQISFGFGFTKSKCLFWKVKVSALASASWLGKSISWNIRWNIVKPTMQNHRLQVRYSGYPSHWNI